jgi:hypothetical protein
MERLTGMAIISMLHGAFADKDIIASLRPTKSPELTERLKSRAKLKRERKAVKRLRDWAGEYYQAN